MATWRQCEQLVEEGKVRYIGMSNMTIPKLEAVLPLCRIKPAALEMELHPGFQQPELFDYAKAHDILPVGYCPIGSPSRPERDRTAEDMWRIRRCRRSWRSRSATTCIRRIDLPEMGGAERTGADPVFREGAPVYQQPEVRHGGSADR